MKLCTVCGDALSGRTDKIYCSPKCKNVAYLDKVLQNDQLYYLIDKQLKRNRKILRKYNREGFTTLRKQKLLAEGFNPKYFTHYWKNQKGQVYLFCYDVGFLEIKHLQGDKYVLVVWQSFMDCK